MEPGFLNEFIAGNVGGMVGIAAVYPLDTAKTRLQVNPQYRSTYHVISQMVSRSGYTAVYRGLTSPALGYGLSFAVSFSGYNYACKSICSFRNKERSALTLGEMAIAGGFTGALQSPVRQVFERIKSVMQVAETATGKCRYSSTTGCISELVRAEGLGRGLFQGYSSVLLREIPQFALYYPSYAIARSTYEQWCSNARACQFLAGGTAGLVQWLPPTYCFDVVKSRMQTAPSGTYSGIADCVMKMYAEQGMGVFFRGLSPALLRAFPLHGIIFLCYEQVKGLLLNRQQQSQPALRYLQPSAPAFSSAPSPSPSSPIPTPMPMPMPMAVPAALIEALGLSTSAFGTATSLLISSVASRLRAAAAAATATGSSTTVATGVTGSGIFPAGAASGSCREYMKTSGAVIARAVDVVDGGALHEHAISSSSSSPSPSSSGSGSPSSMHITIIVEGLHLRVKTPHRR